MRTTFALLFIAVMFCGACQEADGGKAGTQVDTTGLILDTGNHADGKVAWRGYRKNGAPWGLWERWWPNGQLKSRVNFDKNGVTGKEEEWHMNGQPRKIDFHDNENKTHKGKMWYADGTLWQEYESHNVGEVESDGKYLRYYPDGKKYEDCVVGKNGVGKQTAWDQQGKVIAQGEYSNFKRYRGTFLRRFLRKALLLLDEYNNWEVVNTTVLRPMTEVDY
jgi:antitoxin component YwqK of YwqJK toxin-antitoxin module